MVVVIGHIGRQVSSIAIVDDDDNTIFLFTFSATLADNLGPTFLLTVANEVQRTEIIFATQNGKVFDEKCHVPYMTMRISVQCNL